MSKLVFKIQSFVDIITNSSTEIYTMVGSGEYLKQIINGVLLASGSNKKFDDLFILDYEYEYIPDSFLDLLEENNMSIEDIKNYDNLPDTIIFNYWGVPYEIKSLYDWCEITDSHCNSHYIIKTKDNNKEADKLLGVIRDIYYHEAIYG